VPLLKGGPPLPPSFIRGVRLNSVKNTWRLLRERWDNRTTVFFRRFILFWIELVVAGALQVMFIRERMLAMTYMLQVAVPQVPPSLAVFGQQFPKGRSRFKNCGPTVRT
jgi:hypothetical protein